MAIGDEIFKNTQLKLNGAFTADRGIITSQQGLPGVMMQTFGLQYQQNVSRIYDLGVAGETANVYIIGGRSQGMLNVGHIVGPKLAMKKYYQNFSDLCQADKNDITVGLSKADCLGNGLGGAIQQALGGKRISYTAKFCVLQNVALNVSAQDMLINQQSQLSFSNLEYTEG